MAPQIQPLYFRLLQLFDQAQFLRDRFLNNEFAQFLGVLYSAGSLSLASVMLVYWLYCSALLVTSADVEVTDADIAQMRWNRRWRARLQCFFLSNRWMLT